MKWHGQGENASILTRGLSHAGRAPNKKFLLFYGLWDWWGGEVEGLVVEGYRVRKVLRRTAKKCSRPINKEALSEASEQSHRRPVPQ